MILQHQMDFYFLRMVKLYVVESDNKYVYSWDVAPDGSVSGKLNLAELQTQAGWLPC